MTDSSQPLQRVMVIAAHPDDPEFGCAATIAKWASDRPRHHLPAPHERRQGLARAQTAAGPARRGPRGRAARRGRRARRQARSSSSATPTACSRTRWRFAARALGLPPGVRPRHRRHDRPLAQVPASPRPPRRRARPRSTPSTPRASGTSSPSSSSATGSPAASATSTSSGPTSRTTTRTSPRRSSGGSRR